jgi:murein DD-endopeptidase MepM/ murein hydrolase activator NlpD
VKWIMNGCRSLCLLLLLLSCNRTQRGLFGNNRSAHDKYTDGLRLAGLDHSIMGMRWTDAGNRSLVKPVAVTLPYQETGYFSADEPRAASWAFSARRGTRLSISLKVTGNTPAALFTEIWQAQPGLAAKWLTAADSSGNLRYDVPADGSFICRLQPQLLAAAEYTILITAGASLGFPVSAIGKPRMISFWSDPRDAGARRHEGVDIAAQFRSPAVAACDGFVESVTSNRLGGNVIFLRPEGKPITLYYAHLDTQLVTTGQSVVAGQVLGLVGNTGNAIHTIPHLHFGVYTASGAIDPLPFIDNREPSVKPIVAPLSNVGRWMRTQTATPVYSAMAKDITGAKFAAGAAVRVLAATRNLYQVELPDGSFAFAASDALTSTPVSTRNLDTATRLLDEPDSNAASKILLAGGSSVTVQGSYQNFWLVSQDSTIGWIRREP